MSAPRSNTHQVRPCRIQGMDKATPTTSAACAIRDQKNDPKTRKSCCYEKILPAGPCHDHGMDHDATKLAISLPELAVAIGANVRSLRNAFYARPQDFPPVVYLPGTSGPRCLMTDVQIWLESRKAKPASPPPAPVTPTSKGRPRKASATQIARARLGKGGAA